MAGRPANRTARRDRAADAAVDREAIRAKASAGRDDRAAGGSPVVATTPPAAPTATDAGVPTPASASGGGAKPVPDDVRAVRTTPPVGVTVRWPAAELDEWTAAGRVGRDPRRPEVRCS